MWGRSRCPSEGQTLRAHRRVRTSSAGRSDDERRLSQDVALHLRRALSHREAGVLRVESQAFVGRRSARAGDLRLAEHVAWAEADPPSGAACPAGRAGDDHVLPCALRTRSAAMPLPRGRSTSPGTVEARAAGQGRAVRRRARRSVVGADAPGARIRTRPPTPPPPRPRGSRSGARRAPRGAPARSSPASASAGRRPRPPRPRARP